jgi:hypothetical protein
MHAALDQMAADGRISGPDAEELGAYLDMAARQLVNVG